MVLAAAAAVLTGLAGCAGNDAVTLSENRLTSVETAIERAEQAGAYEHGGAELTSAREKLGQAREAAQEGEADQAARLADEAELDAELAMAMLQNAEAQAAVQELRNSIDTLREEIDRGAQNEDSPRGSRSL